MQFPLLFYVHYLQHSFFEKIIFKDHFDVFKVESKTCVIENVHDVRAIIQ